MKPTNEELVTKYIKLVYYYARRWGVNSGEVDDVVQETYRKALVQYKSFIYNSENQVRSWLLMIARNIIFDKYKSKRETIQIDDYTGVEIEDNAIEVWIEQDIKREQFSKVAGVIELLTEKEKDIIKMRFYEEFSFKEIAKIYDTSEAVVKMRCYRALGQLKQKLL